MREPKLGDVVYLKSCPEQPMTVAGYDVKAAVYGVVWISEKQGHAMNVPGATLVVAEDQGDASQANEHLAAALAHNNEMSRQLVAVNEELVPAKAELASLKKERLAAVLEARKGLQEVNADASPIELVRQLLQRVETLKREGNEQIGALQQKLALSESQR